MSDAWERSDLPDNLIGQQRCEAPPPPLDQHKNGNTRHVSDGDRDGDQPREAAKLPWEKKRSFVFLSLSLSFSRSLFLTHTHTHTHSVGVKTESYR